MTEQRVSFRYARAILETAVQEKVSDKIFGDFLVVNDILADSRELRVLTSSPVLQHWKKKEVYQAVFEGRISTLTLNFLMFLLDKKRGDLIPSIIAQYVIQYNIMNNKLPVEIYSAIELNDNIKQKIVNELEDWTQKTILPDFKLQPELKGGMMIKVDDWVYDASLKNQLEILYKKLADEGL